LTRRSRIVAYGGAAALTASGVLCAVLVQGGAGPVVAMTLVGLGLIALVSLVFLEVGLSEDRDRARANEGPRPRSAGPGTDRRREVTPPPDRTATSRPSALDRRRGRRRRLR
jgi:hypothetical protein